MGRVGFMICVLVLMVVEQGLETFDRRSISRCSLFDSPNRENCVNGDVGLP